MYEIIRLLPFSQLALQQVPQLAIALAIAELFYKFHSFVLESVAFLVTWFVLGAAQAFLRHLLMPVWENKS